MKIKALVLAFLLVGMIAVTIGAVSARIPPAIEMGNAEPPDVWDLVPDQGQEGLDIADSEAPDVVPPT